MKVSIVGHGIAGLMLGEKLSARGINVSIFGKGPSQAPPQVIVHFHAGRSFRRSKLECLAFEKAVSYWRSSPFATEVKVNRDTNPRLEKSFKLTQSYGWEEPIFDLKRFTYGPAFIVMASELRMHLLEHLNFEEREIPENITPAQRTKIFRSFDHIIFAKGFKNRLPICSLNKGISIFDEKGAASEKKNCIRIGKGIHHAINEKGSSLGGAFLNDENAKERLFEKARYLLKDEELNTFEKKELFVGQKSVSKDRLPIIGLDRKKDFLFTAFGARAFFWLPFCTELAHAILVNPSTVNALSPTRFQAP